MKFLDVERTVLVSAFVLSLAVMTSVSTFAQPNSNNTVNSRTDRTETTKVVERDHDTDWGWLGLLGLLGLAGLLPKKRRVEVQEFRDTAGNRPASGAETTH